MLKRMQEKETTSRTRIKEGWFLYIVECSDGSLYTGVTKDIERRLKMHNKGSASRYTRIRRPVVLRYKEICASHTKSLVRECAVKALPRKKKETLIKDYLNNVPCAQHSRRKIPVQ